MLELVMPVLPHRLSDDWRKVIEQMDFLDVPGMRAVRTGIEQGKRTEANTLEEQMEIVKRGKVSYLFERYTDELADPDPLPPACAAATWKSRRR